MTRPTLAVAIFLAFVASVLTTSVSAFNAFGGGGKAKAAAAVPLPTFDEATGRYTKNPADDGQYPYDAIGAALRHGPAPFLTRTFNADEYEQGVLKYMLTYKVDRSEATGNTDARLNNAVDWQYQKMAEQNNGAPKVDYTYLDPKRARLTAVWALGITPLAAYVVQQTLDKFANEPGPCVSKAFEGLGICSEYIPR